MSDPTNDDPTLVQQRMVDNYHACLDWLAANPDADPQTARLTQMAADTVWWTFGPFD